MARSRLHFPARLKTDGIRRMATVRDAAFIGCMNDILPRFLCRNSNNTTTTTPGFFDPQLLESVLGRGCFNATDFFRPPAVPLGNTVPRDELKDPVPDSKFSLSAFNAVTRSYDPRSLKSTLLEFKTMRYGVKYIAVPRATAVDWFEQSLLGDMQRGLAVQDAAWYHKEPGQKSPL
eukprot:jgi/Tetstr1/440085/TSEL_028443.t1